MMKCYVLTGSLLVCYLFVATAADCPPSEAGRLTDESILWLTGTWDANGKPKGKMLSDNPMWFGPRIFTGVTYEWEEPPTFPLDVCGGNRKEPGRRLIGGKTNVIEWDTVGRPGDKPLIAVFDFKRPCVFTEVDCISERCTNATAVVEFSSDRTNWCGRAEQEVTSAITRIRLAAAATGRYMRLLFQALPQAENTWWKKTRGYTFLDEVVVWGDGEVSARYPEDVDGVSAGDSLVFTNTEKGAVSILPMTIPHLSRKPCGATPTSLAVNMARNETESRYFAVVNGGTKPMTVSLTKPDFGKGTLAELLVGGVLRISPPKRKLSDTEMVQLHTNDRDGINKGDAENLDVLPFFFPHALLPDNCLRKYLANPQQVKGFPDAVPLAPGEGCVVMLRLTTNGTAPGVKRSVFTAGPTKLPIEVEVVDLVLPQQKMWIYAYRPFTWQFPYESGKRVRRDVERYLRIGATSTQRLPEPYTKEWLFFRRVPDASVSCKIGDEPKCNAAFEKIRKGKFESATEDELKLMTDCIGDRCRRAGELGLKREQMIVFLPDEPGPGNGRAVMKMARRIKRDVPNVVLHCNPLCYRGGSGFLPSEEILELFLPEYNDCVDVSCPIDTIVGRPELQQSIWGKKRLINAQYNHPAGRTGTHMAYDSVRKGLDGFGYYCYYNPNGSDPWDIRTWGVLNYNYQAVFPLEEDIALTPLYEFLREGAEVCRLLDAVKSSGRKDIYDEVLARSTKAWDRTHFQYNLQDPAKEDILSLRDRMLEAFKR